MMKIVAQKTLAENEAYEEYNQWRNVSWRNSWLANESENGIIEKKRSLVAKLEGESLIAEAYSK